MNSKPLKLSIIVMEILLLSGLAVTLVSCMCQNNNITSTPTITKTKPATTTVQSTTTTTKPTITPSGSSPLANLPAAVTLDLTVANLKISVNSLVAAAGADVTLRFHNNDTGIIHNFSIYTDSTAQTKIFQGATITGPGTEIYHFKVPEKGNYYFQCDTHPAIHGTFTVQ